MEIHKESGKGSSMAEQVENPQALGRGQFYKNLSYRDKLTYQGGGGVYKLTHRWKKGKRVERPNENAWSLEWSSGIPGSGGRVKYRKLTVHGTEDEARRLVNLITSVPFRTTEQALEVIAPYISFRKLEKSGSLSRIVVRPIPQINNLNSARRRQIEEDYFRLKLLDTLANLCRVLENYECEGDGVGVEAATLRP